MQPALSFEEALEHYARQKDKSFSFSIANDLDRYKEMRKDPNAIGDHEKSLFEAMQGLRNLSDEQIDEIIGTLEVDI